MIDIYLVFYKIVVSGDTEYEVLQVNICAFKANYGIF